MGRGLLRGRLQPSLPVEGRGTEGPGLLRRQAAERRARAGGVAGPDERPGGEPAGIGRPACVRAVPGELPQGRDRLGEAAGVVGKPGHEERRVVGEVGLLGSAQAGDDRLLGGDPPVPADGLVEAALAGGGAGQDEAGRGGLSRPGEARDRRGESLRLRGAAELQHGHGPEHGGQRSGAHLPVDRVDLLERLARTGGGEEPAGPGEPIGKGRRDRRNRRAQARGRLLALGRAGALDRQIAQGRDGAGISEGQPGARLHREGSRDRRPPSQVPRRGRPRPAGPPRAGRGPRGRRAGPGRPGRPRPRPRRRRPRPAAGRPPAIRAPPRRPRAAGARVTGSEGSAASISAAASAGRPRSASARPERRRARPPASPRVIASAARRASWWAVSGSPRGERGGAPAGPLDPVREGLLRTRPGCHREYQKGREEPDAQIEGKNGANS